MAAVNYIEYSTPVLTNTVEQSLISSEKKYRNKKKHIISIEHYEVDNVYEKSLIKYHWTREKKLRFEHINIFNDTEYNYFIKSYQNRDTIYRGVIISYATPVIKEHTDKSSPRNKQLTIGDEIIIELDQPHYAIDNNDHNWFRISNCEFHDQVFPTRQIHWVQQWNRPALFINSIDCTRRFDSNSLFVYIRKSKVKKDLKSMFRAINFGKLEKADKLDQERRFARIWYTYTLLLWYINWSWSDEWHVKKLNYETFLNLGYYLLWNIDFFDSKKEDCMMGVRQSYIEFLFMKELWNDCRRGIKHTFRDKVSKSIQKETRYMFPEGTSKLQKDMFKYQHPTPCKEDILERNKQIKDLHNQGCSVQELMDKFGIKKRQIYNILKS